MIYTTRYTYDAGNKLISMTLPSGRQITYTRDAVRRTASIISTVNGTAQVIADSISYRADNLLTRRRFGNGLTEQRRYDLQGRLLDQTLGTIDARRYRYDANGNLLERPATSENKAWAYDNLDRLMTDTTNNQVVQLGYDTNGNRLSRAANDNAFNEVYDYAQAGNRLAILDKTDATAIHTPTQPPPAERTLNYNNAGRLYQVFDNGVLTATYIYNGDGLRTRKVTAAGTLLYHYNQQGKLVSETREDGTLIREYIWQDNEPIAQIDIQGTTESLVYLHTDHMLTPRLATDETGIVAWRWEGEAFGQAAANEDPDGDGNTVVVNLRFPGQYYDKETGLHYNYFRYYDPSTGRYISEDPIGLKGGINLYAYVGGNPINGVDPSGLQVFGLNFGGGVTIPFTSINVSGSVAFVIDSNLNVDAVLSGEIGAGTSGGGVFARGLFGAGDNTVASLQGLGASVSLSVGRVSTSVSLPVRATPGPNGFPEGDFGFFPPVFELGVGFGTPFQSSVAVTFGSSLTKGNCP